jgi:hypothetical protein
MSYLNLMYGRKSPAQTQSSSDKNPNRVSGGLKAQGVDHVVMVSEDGSEAQVPTQRYVQSLEEQIRKQRAEIAALQKKVSRLDTAHGDLQKFVTSRGQ